MIRTWNFAKRPFQDDRPVYAVAGALFLAGTLLAAANLRRFSEYRGLVADTRADVATLEDRQRRADEKANAAKAALASYQLSSLAEESRGLSRILAERKFSWTTLLSRLERTLPPDVGLSHLTPSFDKDEVVALSMQLAARNREAVVKTVASLSHDPAFTNIELRSETAAEAGSPDPIQFNLTCQYDSEARR
jgi:Fimbrial assembly protein (PilN)